VGTSGLTLRLSGAHATTHDGPLERVVRSVPDITAVSGTSLPTPWRQLLAPVSVTIALVVWALEVSPHSVYGDTWAIGPALLALPAALIWHVALIILRRGQRRVAALVAVCHLVLLAPIWIWSLI